MNRSVLWVITCEHGGNHLPPSYQPFFRGAGDLLTSHRGYDPGALELARRFARTLGAPLFFSTTSRLLVDLNRSLRHPSLHASLLDQASRERKEKILRRYYYPYRTQVRDCIAQSVSAKRRVFHLSVHSFTPVLDGQVRQADVGVLYDPRRPLERLLAGIWLQSLKQAAPPLRLRRNYPYLGISDGFTTTLRKEFPPDRYAGLELEVNQRFPLGDRAVWKALQNALVSSLQVIAMADEF